jgi:DNA-binding transcriptional regulator GbsR (MarR family)
VNKIEELLNEEDNTEYIQTSINKIEKEIEELKTKVKDKEKLLARYIQTLKQLKNG